MRVGEYCTREVAFATRAMGIGEAAQVMRAEHVGDLVVVEESAAGRRPVGIVTDRDLVMEVLAPGLDPDTVTVGDLPTRELAVAGVDDDLMDTLARMGTLGVRRMPVVDGAGALAGILAADDVLEVVSELAAHLVKLTARGVAGEVRRRPGAASGNTVRV
jgi:CBS domain-containing protein